ncbi:hypothetical protein F5148DRAFT_1209497 [Russula earlei]|uniref:Uncharacterized protein n=1 Tax=Russula earlei TaxID=71964 RepID=A0ACC0U7R5_9AGAM|nr:hypothetical protein F5148DRAFT_1209497 [Russula earlei]
MGIQGLLPFLKSIQNQRHLSELAGQTLAVDGYVWLHRGTYTCSTELATGRKTTKYVRYAMQRVRLLRYYGIRPYIVFDGGRLPAKRGTEEERSRRRTENLACAKELTAKGKHSQAREFYSKCVDVTPEMAFQLIKALRAEDVPYVVAPYEADAQLAYLERVGIVDGIITEDSDLLVFGCKNVTGISRDDFGKVTECSLRGWTDAQFRAMAILSGCDYLASIPGVGLKTAWTFLRKYRTAENVIRALRLEGKKSVPQGYLEAFMTTEKVFLYQRVYDPLEEKLVNLTPIPPGEALSQADECFIGEDIAPAVAKRVARGDANPNTHLPIEDIDRSFEPRSTKPLPFKSHDLNSSKSKGKSAEKHNGASILSFFGSNAKGASPKAAKSVAPPQMVAGRASGKRRLMGLMHDDMAIKRKRLLEIEIDQNDEVNVPSPVQSRFFGIHPTAGSSPLGPTPSADTVLVVDEDDAEEVEDAEEPDHVAQEDGYLSPTRSFKRLSTPDLSSPPQFPERSRVFCRDSSTGDFAVDLLSSPESRKPMRRLRSKSLSSREGKTSLCTPRKSGPANSMDGSVAEVSCRPDKFDDADTMEIADFTMPPCSFGGSTQSSSGLDTPVSQEGADVVTCVEDLDLGDDIEFIEIRRAKQDAVARGWWSKWSHGGARERDGPKDRKDRTLRRRETTVTSDGLHGALRSRPNGKAGGDRKAPTNGVANREGGSARRSQVGPEWAHNVEMIRRHRSTGMTESGMGAVG